MKGDLVERSSTKKESMELQNKIEKFENNILYKGVLDNSEFKQGHILDRMKHYGTPALSIAVVKDYKLEWAKAYGSKRRDGKQSIDENTLFQAASISKPVFAVAVMRLVEQGILDLDEDVNNYLTSWKVPKNDNWSPKITLRQILSHTAGTTVHGFNGYNINDEIPSVIQVLNGEKPSNSEAIIVDILPGSQYRYSGGGTTIAQQLVVDVMQKPFNEIMKELVLDPLGMENSRYEQPLINNRDNIACGYGYAGDEVEGMFHIYPELAAAGLWTTPSDLAKLGLEIQYILDGKKDGILKVDSVKEMLKPYGKVSPGYLMGIGFRLGEDKENVISTFEHGGMNYGFESNFMFYTENGAGFVVMINSNEGDLRLEVIKTISKMYGLKVDFKEEEKEVSKERININEYVGEYNNDKDIDVIVKKGGEKILFKFGNQDYIEFTLKHSNKFVSNEINTVLEFGTTETGKRYVNVSQDGEIIECRKIK